MKLPKPVAVVTAKVSAFQDLHPRLFGVALMIAAALLITSGLRPAHSSEVLQRGPG